MTEELKEIAAAGVKAAIGAGADQAEACAVGSKEVKVDAEKNTIRSASAIRDWGVSVRAYRRGALGFAFTTSKESIREAGSQAAALATAGQPDPDFRSLPEPQQYSEALGLFDPALAELAPDQVVEWTLGAVEGAEREAPQAKVSASLEVSVRHTAIANSLGVQADSAATYASIWVFAVIRNGDDAGRYHEMDFARRLEDFDPVPVGQKAAHEAKKFLGSRKAPTRLLPVILGPWATHSLLQAIAGAADAESVQRHRSYLAGKRGQRIAASSLSLVDDPFVPAGINSRASDGEGTASTRVALVEEGRLAAYLHNSYTAHKAAEQNTGHARRNGYRAAPFGTGPTNLVPSLGSATSEDIIADTEEGIYINAGGIMPNLVSGALSATVDFGFFVEKGSLSYPVAATMIGGDMLSLLQTIDAISSDYREEPGMILPTIRIARLQVAGA